MESSTSAEDRLDQQPVLWECGAPYHLISIGPGDHVTDLRHKLLNDSTDHPERILQSGVAVTSGEMSEGYCQLQGATVAEWEQSRLPPRRPGFGSWHGIKWESW